MKRFFSHFTLFLFASIFTIACSNTTESTETTETDTTSTQSNAVSTNKSAVATLSGTKPDTTVNGTVQFTESDGKVKMSLQISIPNKANQKVAVHIHENGSCDNNGDAAGGHWNPTGQNHGQWGNDPFHSGDIGNINLDGNGNGTLELETDLWSIGGDEKKNILNKSIIVHGGVDDFTSQPAGNAGSRLGCGIISQSGN